MPITFEYSKNITKENFESVDVSVTMIVDMVGLMPMHQYARYRGELEPGESLHEALQKLISNKLFKSIDNLLFVTTENVDLDVFKHIESLGKRVFICTSP